MRYGQYGRYEDTVEVSLVGIWAAALLEKDKDPGFSKTLLNEISEAMRYGAERYAAQIRRVLDEAEPPFKLEVDEEVITLVSGLCASGAVDTMGVADTNNPYPVGWLHCREVAGEHVFEICKRAGKPEEASPKAISSRFMLSGAVRERLDRFTKAQPFVTMSAAGAGGILLHDSVSADFVRKICEGDRTASGSLWRFDAPRSRFEKKPSKASIGKALVRPAGESTVLVIPEASAMMEAISVGFNGGLLALSIDETQIPKPVSKETEALVRRLRRGKNFQRIWRSVFFAPSIADPEMPKLAWTPADSVLLPTPVCFAPTFLMEDSLALRAFRRYWWLCEGTDVTARILLGRSGH